jgi:hypothetical protein
MADECRKPGWVCLRHDIGRVRWVQVVPVNDVKPHKDSGCDCWCSPKVERIRRVGGLSFLVSHNAADARELVEQHGIN